MKDVTSVFQNYREAARHLSNSCYRPKFDSDWDTREDFDEISILLFKHLVLRIVAPKLADVDGHDVLIESIYVRISYIEEAEQVGAGDAEEAAPML